MKRVFNHFYLKLFMFVRHIPGFQIRVQFKKNLISKQKPMLYILEGIISIRSYEHPKHIFKWMGMKIRMILRLKCLFERIMYCKLET